MYKGPFFLRRLGRRLCWRSPRLYRSFGLLRGRGDCLAGDFALWIDGFPRSANTFAVEAFQMANPTARVASHHHIPTFIVHALDQGKPGIFLIRKPEDSVVSWAIYWKGHLKACLDYYIDYHHTLLPYIPKLFIAPFEVTTTRFDRVIDGFNQAFGTNYAAFKHDPAAVSDCFSRIEKVSPMDADGSVNEFAVCRPSPRRNELKPKMLQELRSSPLLLRKLGDANALYAAFCHAPSPLALPDTPPRRHQVLQTVS